MLDKHPYLRPIPGQNDPYLARKASEVAEVEAQENTRCMALDALDGLPFPAFLEVFEAALEARPDIDPELLEAFSNRVGTMAHMKGRDR